ncbi:Ig-like domain-containing protein [Streptomyces caniscabiei]|uniref:right-handed parallel beta-helix repeat-containing protein n=1 Tax=Streptomyces caniscabiei TaxID=2746961 RepID=UPI0029A77E29|nr:right-handed parallel beta-helix repeat-containing protein [Streptomyces caniscabiei]MDX2776667.1 Ig-like domain-containing protein [Streptomyces caniscabiei]
MKIKIVVGVAVLLVALSAGWLAMDRFFSHRDTESDVTRADMVAPTVMLHIPWAAFEQAKIDGFFEVSVEADDNSMIERVEYLLDDAVVARSINPPFTATITLSRLAKGKHTLQAVAYDLAGNVGKSAMFTFVVDSDTQVEPADDTASQEIVYQSGNRVTARNVTAPGRSAGRDATSGENSLANPPQPSLPSNPAEPTSPVSDPARTAGGWYASPPAQVCTSNAWSAGPATAAPGAIVVPAGDNTSFDFSQSNTVYWFAPGEHTLGSGQYSKITPGSGSSYIGAPGAILDGKNNNQYAFAGSASNVRIAYLDIRNFGRGLDNNNEGVINHDAATGWVMEYLYAHHNDGAAVFLGSSNTIRYSCLKDNGQYGFSMYKDQVEGDSAIEDIVIDHNEITGNNQDNWEVLEPGCGCTGGGKFWDVRGARVTNNYVHHNLSVGLWADTNDIDFLFDSNWVEQNSGEGIWYEISYNATMSRNVLKRNNWTSGNNNLGSPAPAIYISESSGDSRLSSSTSGSTDLRIQHNLLEDNFSGISIYENANRFCNSNGNTSKTYCTPFVAPTIIPSPYNFAYPNPINASHPCYTSVGNEPHTTDCRWHSKNVQVSGNEFRFTKANVPCAGTFCGVQALFATGANNMPWAPAAYSVQNVQNDVMFNNNNKFFNNTYLGDWRFAKGSGETINWDTWRSAPYLQDNGSSISGQTPVANVLDPDTSTLEGSIGKWQDWFSTTVTRSAEAAHTGTHSLKVAMSAGGSWGVELNNWPGFEVQTSGAKRVSFWARQGAGAVTNVRLRVTWYDANQQVISDLQNPMEVPLTLAGNWQKGAADIPAPAGANTVHLQFLSGSGGAGSSIFIDDVVVGDDV